MADRYAYVPSIGIFFLAGAGMYRLIQHRKGTVGWALLSLCTIFFCYKTFAQNKTWKNDLSLWNDVIRQDQRSGVAYNNRAMVYMKSDSVRALDDFTKAIAINPRYRLSLFNRGALYGGMKRNEEAIADYTAAIALDSGYTEAYINRGNVRMDIGQYKGARNDYDSAIILNPAFARAYMNRGLLSMKEQKNKEAIPDFVKATELNPGYEKAWLNKGNAEMNEKMYAEARESYSRVLELNGGLAEAYYNRAWAFFLMNDTASACKDFQRAKAMGYRIGDDALSNACK
jgi:tetratricopeptide (TPR) repeat protein